MYNDDFKKTAEEIEENGLMNMYVAEAIAANAAPDALEKEIKLAIKMHSKWAKQPGASAMHCAVTAAMWRLLAALRAK